MKAVAVSKFDTGRVDQLVESGRVGSCAFLNKNLTAGVAERLRSASCH